MTLPPLRPFGLAGVEAPSGVQAAAFDRHSITGLGVSESALMENAGRQTATLIQHLFPEGPVLALVGSGNNGGDALVCLRALQAWGREVSAIHVGERSDPDPLLHGWVFPREAAETSSDIELVSALKGAGVVVDGLLGTGLRGAPRGQYERVVDLLSSVKRPVVALDTPSGVDGGTGETLGSVVTADVTVAFGWPKIGTLLHPGRAHCGRLIAVEIGFPPKPSFGAEVLTPGWADARRPRRESVTHKNAVGALCLLAGSSSMAGAALLAGRAAFRSGVGLLRVCLPREAHSTVLAALPEAVAVDADDRDAVRDAVQASRALAAGPGMGTDSTAKDRLSGLLEMREGQPLLLDADALTLSAAGGGANLLNGLSEEGAAVVTPHPGEMGRLTGQRVSEVQADRRSAACALARDAGVVVLLKGTPSLVAEPEGRLLVDGQGSSDLAVAGMGDVLTGTLAGLLAQGVPPGDAAGLALYYTGRAAVMAGLGASLAPSDVIEQVPRARSERGPGQTDLPFPWVTFDQDPPR